LPEQWQLTLDVIKSKVQTLETENNGLQAEYRKSIEQSQKLQKLIDAQQYKNEQMSRFLKERHGRTDQQVRISELTQSIKTKNQEARAYNKQLENLKREQRQAKSSQKTGQLQGDDQLVQWHKQLKDEIAQEVLLKNELVRCEAQIEARNDQMRDKIKALREEIDVLRGRVAGLERRTDFVQGQVTK
jgi:chromosome segregation ATPase